MSRPLTILFTNMWLVHAAGSETVIRDLARGVLRRGHRPIVYSPYLGPCASEIARAGVSVIDDIRALGEAPDIIHAHHSIPCGESLIRFPDVPAISVCHSFDHWVEAPVHFPQIAVYVAVDETCRDRLVHREGIEPEKVVVLHNAVDLERIPARPDPLPQRPARAVAFGKAASMAEPRLACERLGIEFAAIGAAAGNVSSNAEQELVRFDLAFASARAALEALCCGCAVVACDDRGIAGLVTTQNFDILRARNFGLRSLRDGVTVDRCVQEIGRYHSSDAALVAQRARQEADLERQLDQFEKLYVEVLHGARRPQITRRAHDIAVARFMHENLPRRPGDVRWPWLGLRDQLEGQVSVLEQQLATSAQAGRDLESRILFLEQQLANSTQAGRDLESRISFLEQQLANSAQAGRDLEARLALIGRSRLLKVGRFLRRIAGRPIPY